MLPPEDGAGAGPARVWGWGRQEGQEGAWPARCWRRRGAPLTCSCKGLAPVAGPPGAFLRVVYWLGGFWVVVYYILRYHDYYKRASPLPGPRAELSQPRHITCRGRLRHSACFGTGNGARAWVTNFVTCAAWAHVVALHVQHAAPGRARP